jgi:hypothetical protein
VNTGALLPMTGSGTSLRTLAARAGDRSSCSWRAGCGGIRKSGSPDGGEETTGREGRHRRLAADPASRQPAATLGFTRAVALWSAR